MDGKCSAELLVPNAISQIPAGGGQMCLHLGKGRLNCWAGYEEIKQASMRGREGAECYFNLSDFQGDSSCLGIGEYDLSLVTWLVNNNKDQSHDI